MQSEQFINTIYYMLAKNKGVSKAFTQEELQAIAGQAKNKIIAPSKRIFMHNINFIYTS